jgi:hypothetical protein
MRRYMLSPPTGGLCQKVLQLLLPELCIIGGEVPARVFALRDQEQPSVLHPLKFTIHDPGFRRIAFIICRIDRQNRCLGALQVRRRIVVFRRSDMIESMVGIGRKWRGEKLGKQLVGRFAVGSWR